MRTAKSIDEIYDEVKDFDIVLCNDAPLALALNNRVDTPRLGPLAVTPRQYAASNSYDLAGKGIIGDIALVKSVANDTGYGIKYVHGEIVNVQRMLRFTSAPEVHLKSRQRRVCRAYMDYNTVDTILLRCDAASGGFFDGRKVAVVGGELYDELDKHMNPNPGMMTEVDIFKRGEYVIPEIRLLRNDREIAECAADIVMRTDPLDVAIVMDSEGSIADSVRSALYRNHIPFINSLEMRDLTSIRDYLEFVALALRFDTLRVRDVRSLISSYGGDIWLKHDEYSLSAFLRARIILPTTPRAERTLALLDLMSRIEEYTFSQVSEFCILSSQDRGNVTLLLRDMECAESPVTQQLLDDLYYAVNSIGGLKHNEQISDDEKKGVLLADCKNSVYVDRPVVIYVGLGTDWDRTTKDLDFLSPGQRMDEDDRNRQRFDVLMQQGNVRFYLAKSVNGNQEAQPCTHFTSPDGSARVTSFEQACERTVTGPWEVTKMDRTPSFSAAEFDLGERGTMLFSQSSFNTFYRCPRAFMYSRLARSADKETTFTGTLVHDYAEFRLSYPKTVKELIRKNGPDYFVNRIADRCELLDSPELREIARTEIRIMVDNVDRYAEELKLPTDDLVDRSVDKEPNMFLDELGLTRVSSYVEASRQCANLHLKGIMDILNDDRIYDLKTGRIKTPREVCKNMSFDEPVDYPDFQPLAYLTLIRENGVDDGLFTLKYLKTGAKDRVKGAEPDKTDVKLFDCGNREAYMREHKVDIFKKTNLEHLNFDDAFDLCLRFWEECRDNDEQKKSDLIRNVQGCYTNKGDNSMKAERFVNNFIEVMKVSAWVMGSDVEIFSDTFDRFEKVLLRSAEDETQYYVTEYPAKPLKDCSKCDYRDMCTATPASGGEHDDLE